MKKFKIGFNEREHQRNEMLKAKQLEYLQEANYFFVKHHLKVDSEKLVKRGFVAYFNSLFAQTYVTKLPEALNAEQRYKLMQIDIKELEKLEDNYRLHAPIENPDFNIYAETDRELQKFESATKLLNAFNEFREVNQVNPSSNRILDTLTHNAIFYNSGELKVNIYGWVKNENV